MQERLQQAAENQNEMSRRDFLRGAVKGTLALGAATAGVDMIAKITGLDEAEAVDYQNKFDRSKYEKMSRSGESEVQEARKMKEEGNKMQEEVKREKQAIINDYIKKAKAKYPNITDEYVINHLRTKQPWLFE